LQPPCPSSTQSNEFRKKPRFGVLFAQGCQLFTVGVSLAANCRVGSGKGRSPASIPEDLGVNDCPFQELPNELNPLIHLLELLSEWEAADENES
jgi:hypothetical protein